MVTKASSLRATAFATLQKVGQSLMVPVSVLPAAGLLVALGRLGQGHGPFLENLSKVMFNGGLAIFEQLPVVFAVGVAIGFTGGAGVAGLASVVGYFTMVNVLKVIVDWRHLSASIDTGVLGGIIIGLMVAKLYQRFYQTRLHPIFGFFAGKRLVPIVTAGCAILLGLALGVLWPPIQNAIQAFGNWVMSSPFGPAFYAAGKRALIPVGLHHVYYPSFLYQFGSFTTASGQVLHGDSARYFAGDPTAGRFMASEFPLMLFGLPAATLAMILRAKPENRKAVAGVMISAALTSIVTGITEPIEFAFIFVAPMLYVFHVLAAFVSGWLTGFFDVHLGYTFSASLIDYFLGFFNAKNSIYLWLVIGPIMALVYFGVFYWAIGFFNYKTPGREDEADVIDGSLTEIVAAAPGSSGKAARILAALGGAANIKFIDACITRLRLQVNDTAKVKQPALKAEGAAGVMDAGGGNLQVVFGPQSDFLKEEIKKLMAQAGTEVPDVVTVAAPFDAKIMTIDETPDATFAEKVLGDGLALDPSDNAIKDGWITVMAPFEATVEQIFRTNHAVGLKSKDGLELLIHIGIDTVKLNGQGFEGFVKNGDAVKAGQPLLRFQPDVVKRGAKSLVSPLVMTESGSIKSWKLLAKGSIAAGEPLFEVTLMRRG